ADPDPLTNYWAAVAGAAATQATNDATAINGYELAATGADVQLSDDQGTAAYNYTYTTSGADLQEAQKIADAVHTQSLSDAGYTQQAAIDAAGSFAGNEIAAADAQNADATANIPQFETWVTDSAAAAVTEAQNMEPLPTNPSQLIAAVQAFNATMKAAAIALTPAVGQAGITLAQTVGQADETLATETGNEVSDLATELEGDANTEATAEQAATLTDAQTVDAAGVTRATALAQAQANYALTTGNAQISETLGEGSDAVADATGVATAEANYQIGLATADDNAAHAWASSNGSALGAFDAAYADAELSWLTATSSAYITDKTNQAQADANYANQAAGLDATLNENTTAQDGSLAITQAQLYQAEQDAIAGYEQGYAVAQTEANGADIAGRMEALANRSLASAQDGATALLTQAQDNQNYEIAAAAGATTPLSWVNVNALSAYGLSEINAEVGWVNETTPVDWTQQTTLADADQSRGDQEAAAAQSYAQQVADAQWTHDENVALLQEANAATLAGDEQGREEAYASADATLQTAEYTSAASVMTSLSSAVGTPWAQYLAGAANAASNWWSSNESSYLGYQNTLTGDQAANNIAVAQAVQTQANAMADADRTLAYAQAGAADTQAVNDDAAQQAEQTADANNDLNYQQGLAQGDLNSALQTPGFNFTANLDAVDQTYLTAEMNAQDTLTTTTNGDALTDSTSLANAQFTWTQSADAATEGYLYSTAQADDGQVHNDAQATAQYQTNSAASYASAIHSFDQAHPSPWADYAAAMASAQSTLSSNSASALGTEQIALADADFGQSYADALAQQALDDAQASASTNLSNAQQAAESNLASAQTVFDNATAFQFSTQSDQLPDVLLWGSLTPLTGWQENSQAVWTQRDGVTLPLAMPYQAGYPLASGFGATTLNDASFFSGSAFGESNPSFSFVATGNSFFTGVLAPKADMSWTPFGGAGEYGWMVPGVSDLALNSAAIVRGTLPGTELAPFGGVPAPDDFTSWPGSATHFLGLTTSPPGAQTPPPSLTPPLPDDAVHQDYASDEVLVNPSYNAASDNFDDTGMG
ncbi:MAG TPA: hypothetical protein VGX76_22020, partial [Pirellulales bacterium]|nr:hypothetical protein [Pirellulales bacterium]